MTRSRRRPNSGPPGKVLDHTTKEWVFARQVKLCCTGKKAHVLGVVRQDSVRTTATAKPGSQMLLEFAGPPEEPTRTIRWRCEACDKAAIEQRIVNRDGRYRQSEVVAKASGVLELLDALRDHGPSSTTVRVDRAEIAARIESVRSGDQLAAHIAGQESRERVRYPNRDTTAAGPGSGAAPSAPSPSVDASGYFGIDPLIG